MAVLAAYISKKKNRAWRSMLLNQSAVSGFCCPHHETPTACVEFADVRLCVAASPSTPNAYPGGSPGTPSTPGSASSRSNFWEKGPKVEELTAQELLPMPDPDAAVRCRNLSTQICVEHLALFCCSLQALLPCSPECTQQQALSCLYTQ
jgi:hypothetical protein